jgi:toxin ParE1/3/4
MRFEVFVTEGAERDLEAIHQYIMGSGSREEADHVLDRLMEVAESLAAMPERGSHPREIQALGILEYRQAFFKPYRVIYQVLGKRVVIGLIVDGRRDLQTLLENRLLLR